MFKHRQANGFSLILSKEIADLLLLKFLQKTPENSNFFFWISPISILCNTGVPEPWYPPQRGSLSAWPYIHLKRLLFHHPPFEGHVGKILWIDTSGKALGPLPEKLHRALIYEKAFSLFCFSYFLLIFNVWVTIFQSRWTVVMSTTAVSQVRETPSVLYFCCDQWSLILRLPSYCPFHWGVRLGGHNSNETKKD